MLSPRPGVRPAMNLHVFAIAVVAGLTALSLACASSGAIPVPAKATTPAVPSQDDAIDAALQRASGLIGDGRL